MFDKISDTLLVTVVCVLLSTNLSWASTIVTTSTTATATVTYPSLVECVCNTTLASSAVVKTTTSTSQGQTQKYVLPKCLDDVFAETGIRWYLDGPLQPGVTYWRVDPPKDYSTGRAAQRLIRLGYRCYRLQLYDSTDPYY